jgi:hypothetical protein
MIIVCLFGQRKENYSGEYAPELLAAIDGYGNDDNPDYLNDEEKKYRAEMEKGTFTSIKRIEIEVNDAEFDRIFHPENAPLKGNII